MDYKVRLLAFHFPQFHPIPENDLLWGKGFTEWSNVAKARPLFRGHYQPQLPADLGYYDLRLPEARQAQADMAREYGIHGICYYHYWLHGHRLLERPVEEIMATGKPDMPFCLCWANEHWTRKWDGLENEVLVRQDYSDEDDLAHIRWLCSHPFRDPRYVRIDGKPVFLIYRALRLPNPAKTVRMWREEAHRLGLGEIYLCRVETFADEIGDPADLGFDAAVEFQPDWKNLGRAQRQKWYWKWLRRLRLSNQAYGDHRIFSYETMVRRMLQKPTPAYKRFPCVTPAWDNSPRKKREGVIIHGSTPELYEGWLTQVLQKFVPYSSEENLAFVCALNEWAEGNHLEPCQRWGHAYLESTRRALETASGLVPRNNVPGVTSTARVPEVLRTPLVESRPAKTALAPDLSADFQELREFRHKSNPANSAEKKLMARLDEGNFFLHLYNLASLAAKWGERQTAEDLFQALSEVLPDTNPELAGKCMFKRAVMCTDEQRRTQHLETCLKLYPAHESARKWLNEIRTCVKAAS